jgi:cytochrome b6-f complex iron-sulfur subunit
MEAPSRSRRRTLGALIASALGGASVWRFLTPRDGGARPAADAFEVPLADVPAEGALVMPSRRCAIVRRGDEVTAVDLTCTHLGCTVKGTAQGFACPCHGSRFGPDGGVLRGPAARPLARLAVVADGRTVRVSRG